MAPPQAKSQAARKRTRKRKRRAVSSSDSSSSSGHSSSSDDEQPVARIPVAKTKTAPLESSSSSSASDSDSDSSHDVPARSKLPSDPVPKASASKPTRRTPSPTPPPTSIPQFLPSKDAASEQDKQKEQALKERFRKFWMASVVDAFKDDLEEIRKEPNLTSSRLAMLIDSLAAGGDVLAFSRLDPDDGGMQEMEIVLENNT